MSTAAEQQQVNTTHYAPSHSLSFASLLAPHILFSLPSSPKDKARQIVKSTEVLREKREGRGEMPKDALTPAQR